MHIFFFSLTLIFLFTFTLCQHSFAADPDHRDRAAVIKAVRDFTLASDSSPGGQGASTGHDDPAATASLVSAGKECGLGKTKTSENKRRRRSEESCGRDDIEKERGTDAGTDYDIHIPDTFVDRSKHQFYYPAQLKEDPLTCSAPLLTPVCDDGSYMISKPDTRAPSSPFHFTLPFCRPRTLKFSPWGEEL